MTLCNIFVIFVKSWPFFPPFYIIYCFYQILFLVKIFLLRLAKAKVMVNIVSIVDRLIKQYFQPFCKICENYGFETDTPLKYPACK